MATLDELLSAYIDGRVSAQERQHVEALVARDAAAYRRLSELRYTTHMLAQTPRLPAPRAFTLRQAQVAPARRWNPPNWLQPVYLRSAAALVAVCLLVLLAGDVGFRAQIAPADSVAVMQPASGGLPADQGDPSAIVGKRSTTDVAAQPAAPSASAFLGLAPGLLLTLEITLAALLVILLALAWQVSRSIP